MSQNFSLAGLSTSRTAVRTLVGGLLIAAAVVSVQPSYAQGGHHRGGGEHGEMMGGGRHMGRMLDAVGADDAQRAQIKQIREAAAVDLKALRESGRPLRERARQLMASPNAVDRSAAEILRQDMLRLHDQVSKRRMQSMLDAADVLTPTQRAKLGELMAKRGEHMRDRMKRHHGDAGSKS